MRELFDYKDLPNRAKELYDIFNDIIIKDLNLTLECYKIKDLQGKFFWFVCKDINNDIVFEINEMLIFGIYQPSEIRSMIIKEIQLRKFYFCNEMEEKGETNER
jgi:hypothetical protein